MTRGGFTYLLRKYLRQAVHACPSLQEKYISPHVLRHTCAMMLYQATGDLRKVSLWLGHADMQATAELPSSRMRFASAVCSAVSLEGRPKRTPRGFAALRPAPRNSSKRN